MCKKHPHSSIIHSWAEGYPIQVFDEDVGDWTDIANPDWAHGKLYRVTPSITISVQDYHELEELLSATELLLEEEIQLRSKVELDCCIKLQELTELIAVLTEELETLRSKFQEQLLSEGYNCQVIPTKPWVDE